MHNSASWQPTKFVPANGTWKASRDPSQVMPASRLVADGMAMRYVQALKAHARGRLLDHGCGQSPLYGVYRDLVDEVIAVDWPNSLHQTAYMDRQADLNEAMPFDDEAFDTIISSDVVEHLWNPVAVMADLARVLRPGGTLIIGTPFNYWLHEEPHDYFRWTRYALAELGRRHGLDVVSMEQCGGLPDVLCDGFLKLLTFRAPRLVSPMDRVLRSIGIANPYRSGPSQFSLGTLAVLRKATLP